MARFAAATLVRRASLILIRLGLRKEHRHGGGNDESAHGKEAPGKEDGVAVAQEKTPQQAPAKEESPTSSVATTPKDSPLTVHGIVESVDGKKALMTVKNIVGDVSSVMILSASYRNYSDPLLPKHYWQLPRSRTGPSW